MLGLLISVVADIYSSGVKPSEFSFKKWGDDNLFRLVLAVSLITAGILLGDNISQPLLGIKLETGTAFLCGLGSDTLVNAFIRRQNKIAPQQPATDKTQ